MELLQFLFSFERTPRDGGHGGGCNNDAFSVFGFLAFLLAAANLMMQGGNRKKRSPEHTTEHDPGTAS